MNPQSFLGPLSYRLQQSVILPGLLSLPARRSLSSFFNSSNSAPSNQPQNLHLADTDSGIKKYSSKASNLINSILHGSESSRAQFQELDRSQYYPTLISTKSNSVESEDKPNAALVGSWSTEIGDLDTFVHILTYPSYKDYTIFNSPASQSRKARLSFEKSIASTLLHRSNQICLEFAFWRSTTARAEDKQHQDGGIYELRSYQLKPGRMLEWEYHWKKGLECRRRFCEPVGAWFSQLGDLHQVHHMWCYPDLEERKLTREAAWKVDGWAETVFQTVRLVDHMQANIMVPLEYSPLR
ncbi:hypothetical protein BKA69DRAFT_1128552 [Paraphysoderma sedebokerense]|nr:hypothetical protein BKA69DRAFT_1128552 [Paraphysoderma sedebokerense]